MTDFGDAAEQLYPVYRDPEFPGMCEEADFSGGETDMRLDFLTVYIVLELDGGRDAIDGIHTDEAAANRRRDELNLRADDAEFAHVVVKYVRGPDGYVRTR